MRHAQFREFARKGAVVRMQELQRETQAIKRAFPDLKTFSASTANNGQAVTRSSHMSAKARKAQSMRMKAYWAARRKGK